MVVSLGAPSALTFSVKVPVRLLTIYARCLRCMFRFICAMPHIPQSLGLEMLMDGACSHEKSICLQLGCKQQQSNTL